MTHGKDKKRLLKGMNKKSMQRIHSEKLGESVSKDDNKAKSYRTIHRVKLVFERIDISGWITGGWSRLIGLRLWGILGTIEMGLWVVSKVSLLLILTLHFVLLIQNSFLVLQERVVNENAVDEDLSS
jgi:hypothetical protein